MLDVNFKQAHKQLIQCCTLLKQAKNIHWRLKLTTTRSSLLTVSPPLFMYVSLNILFWKTAETSTWTLPALLAKIGTVTDLASLGGIITIPIRESLSAVAKEQKSSVPLRYIFTWWRENEKSFYANVWIRTAYHLEYLTTWLRLVGFDLLLISVSFWLSNKMLKTKRQVQDGGSNDVIWRHSEKKNMSSCRVSWVLSTQCKKCSMR